MGYSLKDLKEIRHHLHHNPELSGEEKNTAKFVKKQFSKFNYSNIIEDIGGYGIIATFDSKKDGPEVLFRTDMDALPIEDKIDKEYRSKKKNIGHKCGHDGHLTMMLGLADKINENGLEKGKVHLLFQPAEETGQGAYAMLQDKKMKDINPDYAFGYHNVPGIKKGTIGIKEGNLCPASAGLEIELTGKTSHAAEPENGNSPLPVIIKLAEFAKQKTTKKGNFIVITPIHIKLGEKAFGTSPGDAFVAFTLRAKEQKDFDHLKQEFLDQLASSAKKYHIEFKAKWVEEFPVTTNNKEAINIAKKSAKQLDIKIKKLKEVFPWSEDFGHFSQKFKGGFIALGAGENHPTLHHPTYDFPDEILQTGIDLYYQILQNTLK